MKKYNLVLLGTPIYSQTEVTFLQGLIRTLSPISERLLVITGNFRPASVSDVVTTINVTPWTRKSKSLFRAFQFITEQLLLCYFTLRNCTNCDFIVVHAGEYRNVLPLVVCKLIRKPILIHHLGGNKLREAWLENSTYIMKRIIPYLHASLLHFVYRFVDVILLEAFATVKWGQLEKYATKIAAPIHPVAVEDHLVRSGECSHHGQLACFVGRLTPKRDLLAVLRAISIIRHEISDFKLVVVGQGPMLQKYIQESNTLGINESVAFLPFVRNLASVYSKASVLVFPSYEEGIPHVLIEAMSFGVVVVASPVGAIPELIIDGETGFVLWKNQPQPISEVVIRALLLRDEVIKRANQLVQRRYSQRITTEKYLDLFMKLSKGAKRASSELFCSW